MKKLRHKFLSIILSVALIAMFIPAEELTVFADFAGGSGTETDPYQIETADQLFEFAQQVNNGDSFAGETVQLTADIIIPADREWVPIGAQTNDGVHFEGTFDGQNHIISGLTISNTYYLFAGFFAQLQGTIKNTIFVNEVVESNATDGSCTYAGGVCGYCEGTIQNCITFGTFSASGTSHNYAGGIAGFLPEGDNIGMYDCFTNASSCYAGSNAGSVYENCVSNVADVETSGLNLNNSNNNVPTETTAYKAGNGYILWETTTSTLTLNNASIDAESATAINLDIPSVTVDVIGTNSIVSTESVFPVGIRSEKEITITGDGTLNTNSIYSNDVIIINADGTINTPEISALGNFVYTKGNLNAFVWDAKGNYQENNVLSVYGNQELTQNITVWDKSGEDGLTVMQGATLTIPEGMTLTVQADTTITNNGTIINNGTIDLPVGTTAEQLEAMNITGTGSVTIDGKPIAVIDGTIYTITNDISNTGLDLTTEPTETTAYKAGGGFVVYNPTTSTLTLSNAIINTDKDSALITLPEKDVTINLIGENIMVNEHETDDFAAIIQQGEFDATPTSSSPKNYNITVSGSGTLSIDTYDDEECGIFTDGTLIMNSGKIAPSDGDLSLITTDFVMNGGSLISRMLSIKGNANVKGGSILCTSCIISIGDFTMSGGTLKTSTGSNCSLAVMGQFTKTGGTFNGLVHKYTIGGLNRTISLTTYGDAVLYEYDANGNIYDVSSINIGEETERDLDTTVTSKLNIPEGTSLTVPVGASIEVEYLDGHSLSEYATINGKLINNGEIFLWEYATQEDVNEVVRVLKPTGTGKIIIPAVGAPIIYTNDGVKMNVVDQHQLSLTNGTEVTDQPGYTFTGNAQDGYILTLDNLALTGYLTLPSNVPVTIQTNSQSVIEGINFDNTYPGNFTFTGSAPLTINGYISGSGNNGDTITVQGGANVTVNGDISIGGSGGQDGTINVSGTGSCLNITSSNPTGAYCDTVNVIGGATMYVTAQSRGIQALSGGVNVTGGSTLTAGCDYGVYIIGGKLIVDATSKLITNGAIAPFCIVDKANNTSSSAVLSLPGIPTGTQIASVVGTDSGYGYTYWSIVSTGGSLGVTNENSEPVTLTGAAIGNLRFEKIATPDTTPDSTSDTTPPATNNNDASGNNTDNSNQVSKNDNIADETKISNDEKPVIIDKVKVPDTGDKMPASALILITGLLAVAFTKKKKY